MQWQTAVNAVPVVQRKVEDSFDRRTIIKFSRIVLTRESWSKITHSENGYIFPMQFADLSRTEAIRHGKF